MEKLAIQAPQAILEAMEERAKLAEMEPVVQQEVPEAVEQPEQLVQRGAQDWMAQQVILATRG
jgi:hypothetical protein